MQNFKKILTKHIRLVIFIVLILLVVLGFLFRYLTSIQTPPMTYRGVTPGMTTQQVTSILGQPLNVSTLPNGDQLLEFTSTFSGTPNLAVTSNDRLAVFVQRTVPDQHPNLAQFVQLYSTPSRVLISSNYGESHSIYIFEKFGIAVTAHNYTGNIIDIWYFQPSSSTPLENQSPIPLQSEPLPKTP